MPGPVSDSFDPEFSTAANAGDVSEAIKAVRDQITAKVFRGDQTLKYIVGVVHGKAGRLTAMSLSEKDWRVIRFCLNRALDSI
jgi:hypothetical protein